MPMDTRETREACYKTLGLTPQATFDEVKRAYRTLVKRWHPDRYAAEAAYQAQALERFSAITSAYATLRTLHAVSEVRRPAARWLSWLGSSWGRIGAVCCSVAVLVSAGWYMWPATPRQVISEIPLANSPAVQAQSLYQSEYITLGSTKGDVLAIQGTPTWATERMWEYGGSRLYFTADRVTGWELWPASPLKLQLLPATTIDPVPAFFTIGSTKDEVLAVQGTPTRVTERLWEYGVSRVMFTDNRVTRWETWPGSPLKARLSPGDPAT
jgi:hypothetical protein